MRIIAEDLVHLPVVERRAQPPRQPLRASPCWTARVPRNVPERPLELRRRKANRSRTFSVEQQELRHPFRPDVGRVSTAVPFKRRARAQQRDPVRLIERRRSGIALLDEKRVEERRRRGGALEKAARLQVLLPLGVPHRRVGDTGK